MEVFQEAKRAGKVRFLGFSAHSVEAALAAMDRYEFDSVLFPINFAAWLKGSFGPRVLERAQQKNMARLALKGLARQRWPKDDPNRRKWSKVWYQPVSDPREQDLALRFTLSLPVTAAVPPGEKEFFWRAVEIASNFKLITDAEKDELKSLAQSLEPLFQTQRQA